MEETLKIYPELAFTARANRASSSLVNHREELEVNLVKPAGEVNDEAVP